MPPTRPFGEIGDPDLERDRNQYFDTSQPLEPKPMTPYDELKEWIEESIVKGRETQTEDEVFITQASELGLYPDSFAQTLIRYASYRRRIRAGEHLSPSEQKKLEGTEGHLAGFVGELTVVHFINWAVGVKQGNIYEYNVQLVPAFADKASKVDIIFTRGLPESDQDPILGLSLKASKESAKGARAKTPKMISVPLKPGPENIVEPYPLEILIAQYRDIGADYVIGKLCDFIDSKKRSDKELESVETMVVRFWNNALKSPKKYELAWLEVTKMQERFRRIQNDLTEGGHTGQASEVSILISIIEDVIPKSVKARMLSRRDESRRRYLERQGQSRDQ